MLQVFFGSDTNEVRQAALAAAKAAVSEPPHILTTESYESGELGAIGTANQSRNVGNGLPSPATTFPASSKMKDPKLLLPPLWSLVLVASLATLL